MNARPEGYISSKRPISRRHLARLGLTKEGRGASGQAGAGAENRDQITHLARGSNSSSASKSNGVHSTDHARLLDWLSREARGDRDRVIARSS